MASAISSYKDHKVIQRPGLQRTVTRSHELNTGRRVNSSVSLLSDRPFTNLKERKETTENRTHQYYCFPTEQPLSHPFIGQGFVTVGYCFVSLRRLNRQLFTDIYFYRHNNECAGGGHPVCPGAHAALLGWASAFHNKSLTPRVRQDVKMTLQHRRHQVHTLRIEEKGIPGIQATEVGSEDRKLKTKERPCCPYSGSLEHCTPPCENGIV